VLSDAGTSLLTEHAAEVRLRHGRAPTTTRRRRRSSTRTDEGRIGGARKHRLRVARRLRYRRRRQRPFRVVIRTRRHQLVYRGRIAAVIALAALTGAALGTGAAAGHPGIGVVVAGLAVAAWLAHNVRLTRPVPARPHGDGPTPPGGASVREPRHPSPISPAGSAARPRPDQDEPGQAIALI
jgi:hypothetical protein